MNKGVKGRFRTVVKISKDDNQTYSVLRLMDVPSFNAMCTTQRTTRCIIFEVGNSRDSIRVRLDFHTGQLDELKQVIVCAPRGVNRSL